MYIASRAESINVRMTCHAAEQT